MLPLYTFLEKIYSIFLEICYNGARGGIVNMIKCKACGKDIAKNADRCPNCGCINPMDNVSAALALIALAILVIIIGFMVVSCGNAFLFPIFFP